MPRIPAILTNRYTLAYVGAVLLHLLLLLVYAPLQQVLIGSARPPLSQPEASPVAFEFVDVPDLPPSERAPEQTPFRSIRQQVAQDRQLAQLPPSHLPYSEGALEESRDVQTAPKADAPEDGSRERREQKEMPAEQVAALPAAELAHARARERLRPMQEREEAVYGRPSVPPRALQLDNRQSSALAEGGLQLSTYDWEFAPYLAYLKRHIENHISPPPAFSMFGLIEGKTRLRFRIYRDGTMRGLAVLDYQGSPLLRDTSTGAVNLSVPFHPLPEDFPDEYLEITGIFSYLILRNTN